MASTIPQPARIGLRRRSPIRYWVSVEGEIHGFGSKRRATDYTRKLDAAGHIWTMTTGQRPQKRAGREVLLTADEVLDFVDTFAGQENEAEEVRDFVQLAAKLIHGSATRAQAMEHSIMESLVLWLEENDPHG